MFFLQIMKTPELLNISCPNFFAIDSSSFPFQCTELRSIVNKLVSNTEVLAHVHSEDLTMTF